MIAAEPHPSAGPRGAGLLLLKLVACLLVALAGICAALFAPFALLIAATAKPGELAPGLEPWMLLLWCLFAFAASIWMIILGVGAMERPRLRRVFVLLGVAAVVCLSFPPFVLVPAS